MPDDFRPASPMRGATIAHILGPKLRTARARIRTGDGQLASRVVAVGLLGGGLGWAAFHGLRRVLEHFRTADVDLGPILGAKLLAVVLLSFSAILLLSNVISALSTFFLARDLDLVIGSPHRWHRLYAAKVIETAAHSSWMVALMCVPLLAAYGDVYDGGAWFPLVAAAALVPFFAIPAITGSALTLALVRILPARRTRDLLALIALFAAGGLTLLVRLLRPEQLVRPEGFENFTSFVDTLAAPSAPWMPSEWVQRALFGWLRFDDQPLEFVKLWGAAAVLLVLGALLHRAWYLEGFSRAQEGCRRDVRAGVAGERWTRLFAWLAPLPRQLVLKEIRVFMRDTTQWSQLILLGVLVIVYVFNIKLLPIRDDGVGWFLRNLVPFFNLALAGFILASIAARFIFPLVSLEGRTLWLLRSSPLDPKALLVAKYWTGALPLLVLALTLTIATNLLLGVEPFVFGVSMLTIIGLTFALASLALAAGTFFPQFESENAAQIPTSFGGLAFMLSAILLIGALLVIEARPVFAWLRHRAFDTPLDPVELALSVAGAAALCLAATVLPMHAAVRRLRAIER